MTGWGLGLQTYLGRAGPHSVPLRDLMAGGPALPHLSSDLDSHSSGSSLPPQASPQPSAPGPSQPRCTDPDLSRPAWEPTPHQLLGTTAPWLPHPRG